MVPSIIRPLLVKRGGRDVVEFGGSTFESGGHGGVSRVRAGMQQKEACMRARRRRRFSLTPAGQASNNVLAASLLHDYILLLRIWPPPPCMYLHPPWRCRFAVSSGIALSHASHGCWSSALRMVLCASTPALQVLE